jgi:hypothetical protein
MASGRGEPRETHLIITEYCFQFHLHQVAIHFKKNPRSSRRYFSLQQRAHIHKHMPSAASLRRKTAIFLINYGIPLNPTASLDSIALQRAAFARLNAVHTSPQ